MIPYLFDRYYKSNTVLEKQRGTGVGLAIVKEIIQAHQGEVWVESELGVGSTFYVALPVQKNEMLGITQEFRDSVGEQVDF